MFKYVSLLELWTGGLYLQINCCCCGYLQSLGEKDKERSLEWLRNMNPGCCRKGLKKGCHVT